VMRYGGASFWTLREPESLAGFAELLIPIALVPLVLGKVRRERLFLVALFALAPMWRCYCRLREGHHHLAVRSSFFFSCCWCGASAARTSWWADGSLVRRFSGLLDRRPSGPATFHGIPVLEVTEAKRAAMRRDKVRALARRFYMELPARGRPQRRREMEENRRGWSEV